MAQSLIDQIDALLDRKLNEKLDERFAIFSKEMDDKLDRKLKHELHKAAENAAGFYAEQTNYEIGLVNEALGAIKVQVDKIPGIDAGIYEMKSDIKVLKHALTATNVDVRDHEKRITKQETTAHA
jgi:HKD family nuclease